MSSNIAHAHHHVVHHKRHGFVSPEGGVAEVVLCGTPAFPSAYVFYASKQAIDVDGAPNAYNVNDVGRHAKDQLGLDSPASAMHRKSKTWSKDVVVLKHNGEPETDDQGFCYAMTSLTDKSLGATNREKYVDAVKIPYFVLPKPAPESTLLGSFGYFLSSSGGAGGAIYADGGNPSVLGEISLKLAELLRIKGGARGVTSTQSIFGTIFPSSGAGKPKNTGGTAVDSAAHARFQQWGGTDALTAAVEHMSSNAKAQYAMVRAHRSGAGSDRSLSLGT